MGLSFVSLLGGDATKYGFDKRDLTEGKKRTGKLRFDEGPEAAIGILPRQGDFAALEKESITKILDFCPKSFVLETEVVKPGWIKDNLSRRAGRSYSIFTRIVGDRAVSIGVRKDLADSFSPLELFPNVGESFRTVARRMTAALSNPLLKDVVINDLIDTHGLTETEKLVEFIKENKSGLGFASLSRLAELANEDRELQEAFFTNKTLITEMAKAFPEIPGETIRILEPSVGSGAFIPFLAKIYGAKKNVEITAVDISSRANAALKELLKWMELPTNIHVECICEDFLEMDIKPKFDLVVGNPPFSKSIKGTKLESYRSKAFNKKAMNTSAFFLERALKLADKVVMVMPKFLLNTPEFKDTRLLLSDKSVDTIIDFGEKGFGGVLIETIALRIDPKAKPGNTAVISVTENEAFLNPQSYLTSSEFPYWLIYRDTFFDKVRAKLDLGIFDAFRDRQITTGMLGRSGIRVLKSRNLNDDGTVILDILGYDAYISEDIAKNLAIFRYLDNSSAYMAPNMTYNPRLARKPKGVLVNGSVALLILKDGQPPLTDEEMRFISSNEYRSFYKIARNRQSRSLNIDSSSIFFFGRLKKRR
ncbi:MAG: N-6 DNA methylase [Clostridiales bacterium]|nr:N-6 DNA methylase [Clostridiales bacterium]